MTDDQKFYWEKALGFAQDNSAEHAFDETNLYREIHRRNSAKLGQIQQKYTLVILYDASIHKSHYSTILTKSFNISDEYIAEYLLSLENNGYISWHNLAGDITELVMSEVEQYLKQKNILLNIIIKRVEENAVKKS